MKDSITKAFDDANKLTEIFCNKNTLNKFADSQVTAIEKLNELGKGAITAFETEEKLFGNQLPLWRVTSISASGKFIETPNVKSRATMSQARGIRLVYPGRCNA